MTEERYTDVWAQRIDALKGASISLIAVIILGAILVLMSWRWAETLDDLSRFQERETIAQEAQLENQAQLMKDLATIIKITVEND